MKKAIIFDFDGTIVKSEEMHVKAFAKVLEQFGINYDLETHREKYAGRGNYGVLKSVLEDSGIEISEEELKELIKKKKEIFFNELINSKLVLTEGFREFLYVVKQRGLKTAIATGLTREELDKIVSYNDIPLEMFDAIVTLDNLNPKPSPDVYRKALEEIGVEGRDAVAFEDSINGVKSAKDAGIEKVILISDRDVDFGQTYRFRDFIGVLINIDKVLE